MIFKTKEPFEKKPNFSLRPDFISESVDKIDFKLLQSAYGIKTCFIDVDDTVVESGKFDVNKNIVHALKETNMTIYIATNRPKSRDLKNLRTDLRAEGVIHPYFIFSKPTKHYFLHALKANRLEARQTVMIGDRFFQDILGANRSGIYSMLVLKLGKPANKIDSIVSWLEKFITLRLYKKYFK